MSIPDATRQASSNAIAALGSWVSVHTAAAGNTGANEATGGSYARKQLVWTPGTTGLNTGSSVNINVPAGTFVEGGLFSASSGGVFVGSSAFAAGSVVVSGAGASLDIIATVQS